MNNTLPTTHSEQTPAGSLRVLSIFGTRPEAVKMAPVALALQQTPGIESRVCVTAQHRQMLDQVLEVFHIKPDFDLDVMRPNQTLAELTAAVLLRLEDVLVQTCPDWVLVQGDTTTVMAASLLAYYHQIRIGHIEAGLRTGDKWQPFPEEINRRLASVIADLHFAPTEWARQNLLREGIPDEQIVVTGNTVIDALQSIIQLPPPPEACQLLQKLGCETTDAAVKTGSPRLALVTAHRRENFGKPIEDICHALRQLAELYARDVQFIYPVHLNPNIQEPVHRLLSGIPNITLVPPLDYLTMIHVMKHSTIVLTDSGGLQEEAPGLGVPVLVLRQVTERPEGVQAGTVRLVGSDPQKIVAETRRLLDNPQEHAAMAQAANPYGDGHAAERIVQALLASQ